jgi:hypothetical protein
VWPGVPETARTPLALAAAMNLEPSMEEADGIIRADVVTSAFPVMRPAKLAPGVAMAKGLWKCNPVRLSGEPAALIPRGTLG